MAINSTRPAGIIRRLVFASLLALGAPRTCQNTSQTSRTSIVEARSPISRMLNYLNAHSQVRQAMIFLDGRSYDQWDNNLKLRFQDFYLARAENRPLPLGFTGSPEYSRTNGQISRRSAENLALAYMANSIWVEVKGKVPWHLHDYTPEDLRLILDSTTMFTKNNTPNLNTLGEIIPSDPTIAYHFMTQNPEGGSLLGRNQRETIFNLTSWTMNHVIHEPYISSIGQRTRTTEIQTLETMSRRRVFPNTDEPARYWSDKGCQSTTGLIVLDSRSVNIPARNIFVMPSTRYISSRALNSGRIIDICNMRYANDEKILHHSGVGFPSEDLYSPHSDALSTVDASPADNFTYSFPAIQPAQVFLTATELNSMARGTHNERDWNFENWLYERSARHSNYIFLEAYHRDGLRGIRNRASIVFLDSVEHNNEKTVLLCSPFYRFSDRTLSEIAQILQGTINTYGGFANIQAEYQRRRNTL